MDWFCKVLSIRPLKSQSKLCRCSNASLRLVPWRSATEIIRGEGLGVQPGSSSSSPGLGEGRDAARPTRRRPVSHLLHKWGTKPLPDNSREGGCFSHPSHQTVSLKQVTTCHPRETSETSACSSIILNCELIKSQKLSLGVTGFSRELKFTWKNSKSFKQNYSYNLAKEMCIVTFLITGVL